MKKQFTIIAAFVLALSVNAQNVKTYNGQMTKPDWIAEFFDCEGGINGSYSYYEDEGENRILHGAFKVSYNTMCLDGRSLIEICGNYNHGKRNGHWTIKDKNRKTGKDNPYYYYDFTYKDGLLNGKFSFRDNGYEMIGKCIEGSLSDTILFRKYSPFGTSVSFRGKVNNEGLPHGIWIEKNEYKGAIPMETTRLYYNGCLVYRREKDLSSGKITYTYQVSNLIRIPSDLNKIQDTTIDGVKYVDVGGIICGIDTNADEPNDFFSYYTLFDDIYPAIKNWDMGFDTNTYKNVLREKQREIERQEYEKKRQEELQKRMIREAYEWGGQLKNMANHCWGSDAFEVFEKLYKEGGEKRIEEEAEKIIRYEYENYTIGELAEKTKNDQISNTINRKCNDEQKKKPLSWMFSTYDRYLENARGAKVYEAFLWL